MIHFFRKRHVKGHAGEAATVKMMNRVNELQLRYGLANYHISFVDTAQNKVGLRGKRVLEVGGSLPKDFVFNELGVEQWIAVEKIEFWEESAKFDTEGKQEYGTPPKEIPITRLTDVADFSTLNRYEVLSGGVEELPIALYEKFDVIFSIAAFEHIGLFPLALDKMFQALRGGGNYFQYGLRSGLPMTDIIYRQLLINQAER